MSRDENLAIATEEVIEEVPRRVISGIRPPARKAPPEQMVSGVHRRAHVVEVPTPLPAPTLVFAGALAVLLGLTALEVVLGSVLIPAQFSSAFILGSSLLKAGLVAAIFMRLLWDRGLHTIFIGITLAFYAVFFVACVGDRREYDWRIETSDIASRG